MKETITVTGAGSEMLAAALKAVMAEPTISNAVKAIFDGAQVPTEAQQRAALRGMTLQQAVAKLMVSESGTYRASVDGRRLIRKDGKQ